MGRHRFFVALPAVLLSTLSIVASGCSTVPMKSGQRIEKSTSFFGPRYRQGGENLNFESLKEELEKNPASASEANASATWQTVGLILSVVGGGLAGYPLGVSLAGGNNPPWTLAYVGLGFAIGGMAASTWSALLFDSAVDSYNEGLSAPAKRSELRIRLGLAPAAGGAAFALSCGF